MSTRECEWSCEDDTDVWRTGCGQMVSFIAGRPSENDFRFCCYCGKALTESRGDPERERFIARLSALRYHAYACGDLEGARRYEAIRQDLLDGKVGEWCFFVETQERAGRAQGRAV